MSSQLDPFLIAFDDALRTLFSQQHSSRTNPGAAELQSPLTAEEKKRSAALMRVNHVGEVCAQALYNSQALATQKNCMGCHAIDRKMVGPSYKDVAKKYAGDVTAADKLALKIQKGGAGVWGPVPMPTNSQVNEKEAKTLASWVLSLK